VPRLLAENRYLVVGTADGEGLPWVTPVFYAADGEHQILWVSAPDSRHSRNIATLKSPNASMIPLTGFEAFVLRRHRGGTGVPRFHVARVASCRGMAW
jgi:Pyridoxamine 5'-phosphate oxidase